MENKPVKKYKCPNCGQEISEIRYDENSKCKGVTTKCKKCKKIIEININNVDK